ncbi:hypothetical protein LB507_005394 [Fusarium sp. FIESC RH6]|nr:hypothetical protein LB507_005394 [Fusarium sp. FIESC RH6]
MPSIYPVCSHCLRLNLTCKREEPRTVQRRSPSPVATDKPQFTHGSEQIRSGVMQLCQPLDLSPSEFGTGDSMDLVASRRAMLRYYTANLAFLLTTNLENNCFLSAVGVVPSWTCARPAPRVHEAQRIIHRNESCYYDGSLLFGIYIRGNNSWYPHLTGAAAALTHQPNKSTIDTTHTILGTFEGRWLLRNFAYHDIMMSVSMDCRPLLKGFYWSSDDDSLADPYFGFGSRLLFHVSETSVLNADFAERQDVATESGLPKVIGDLFLKACSIEDQLQDWTYPSDREDSPLALLGEAYRNAALIHLYRTLRRHVSRESEAVAEKLNKCVEAICQIVSRVSEGCLIECTLLFPLFMAGGEAQEASHIKAVRQKMVEMIRWRRFRNVETCLDVLDEVWRRRADGSRRVDDDRVDWLDVVKHRDWKLSIS